MADPIVQGNTLSSWILESRLTFYDATSGEYTEEVWAGLYSTVESQLDLLKARGAKTCTPSKGGAVAKITAVFGGRGDEGGGGGGPGGALTEQWTCDPDIVENDLRTLPAWGPYAGGGTDNQTRSDRLIAIDKAIRDGTFSSTIDATLAAYNYGLHASFGIKGYLRAPYTVVRTTTWASESEADIQFGTVWSVGTWASVKAPSWFPEPKLMEVASNGTDWTPLSLQWLRFPPSFGAQNRVFTIRQAWRGAVLWSGSLYNGGGSIT